MELPCERLACDDQERAGGKVADRGPAAVGHPGQLAVERRPVGQAGELRRGRQNDLGDEQIEPQPVEPRGADVVGGHVARRVVPVGHKAVAAVAVAQHDCPRRASAGFADQVRDDAVRAELGGQEVGAGVVAAVAQEAAVVPEPREQTERVGDAAAPARTSGGPRPPTCVTSATGRSV